METRNRKVNTVSDLLSVISGAILCLYSKPFNPTGMKPAKLKDIVSGKTPHTRELLSSGLDQMGMTYTQHLANVTLAEKVIYQQYESCILYDGTVSEFTIAFFKNKDHRVYKELIALLKLECI